MADLWTALEERIDYARFVPKLIPDVERFEYRTRDGERRIVLKNPRGDRGAGTYVSLGDADDELLELMDGERSVRRILVDHLARRGVFAVDRLGRLTALLAVNGFFGEERPQVFLSLRARRAARHPIARLRRLLRRAILWHIASWANVHGPVDALYRLAGRWAFTRAGAVGLAIAAVWGLALWWRELGAGRHELLTVQGSYALGLLAYVVLQVAGLSFHELGHALAIRHHGRRVRRLGIAIYYLMPCAYVDSTDMVMTDRRARIVVSAAGAAAGLALAAVLGAVAALSPAGSLAGSLAMKGATLLVFQNLLQLLPILELDGYHILVDTLDVPLLRQRSVAYARTRLLRRLRAGAKMSREEVGLAAFGVLAIGTSLATLAFGLWIWQARLQAIAAELWASGLPGRLALGVITVIFLGPLVLALAGQLLGWVSALVGAVRRRGAAAMHRAIEERAQFLGRQRLFADLHPAELVALASHLVERTVEPGETIVREGEVGDRFYLVVEGEADVVQGEDERRIGGLGPGDPFGEIALLQRSPRTATVRARTAMRLLELDRGHFHRWARERIAATGRIRSSLEERERIARMPLFAELSPGELDRIMARLRLRQVKAGTDIFRQGDPAQRFYVIVEGEAEVLVDRLPVRRLGPGDHFGEVGVLTGSPRTATVRATSDLVVYWLSPEDLSELVRASADAAGALAERAAIYERAPELATALGTR